MKFYCPACDGPNEADSATAKIRCTWCGTEFTPSPRPETPSGRTVEASVSADHVYQDRYGDIVEVSGNALDDDLVTRLDWTKLNRQ